MKTFTEILSLTEKKITAYIDNDLDKGYHYIVTDRNTSNMKLNQDKYKMIIVKNGKVVVDLGSHPNKTGVPKFSKYKTIDDFKKNIQGLKI